MWICHVHLDIMVGSSLFPSPGRPCSTCTVNGLNFFLCPLHLFYSQWSCSSSSNFKIKVKWKHILEIYFSSVSPNELRSKNKKVASQNGRLSTHAYIFSSWGHSEMTGKTLFKKKKMPRILEVRWERNQRDEPNQKF